MKVAVTGGTGFVGKAIVRELVSRGHEVSLLVRNVPGPGSPLLDGVRFVQGNVVTGDGLAELAEGQDALIHLVGIIRESAANTFDAVHRRGSENAVRSAEEAGVGRYLHMSALGTREDAASEYHRTKWAGEKAVRASGLEWTVFRPSIVFGPEDSFINMLADLMKKSPVMPVFGGGQNLMQPIFVKDVATFYCMALEMDRAGRKTYELGGPDVLSFIQILNVVKKVLNIKCLFLPVPLWFVSPFVRVGSKLGIQGPITPDQLVMLSEDNIRKGGDPVEDFPIGLTGLEEGIREYLKKTEE